MCSFCDEKRQLFATIWFVVSSVVTGFFLFLTKPDSQLLLNYSFFLNKYVNVGK